MTSAPPSPSRVSEPAPPEMVLAAVEPRIEKAPARPVAVTFWKSFTVVVPADWLVAFARLMLTAMSRTRVLDAPEPPSMEDSRP